MRDGPAYRSRTPHTSLSRMREREVWGAASLMRATRYKDKSGGLGKTNEPWRADVTSYRTVIAATASGLLVAQLSLAAFPARADSVADFYRGKTINVYVGVNIGGGYDFEARLLARFMKSHIPGNPTLVVQNMIGAGGIKMANYLYSIAPQDGTAIGMFPKTLVSVQAVGTEGVQNGSRSHRPPCAGPPRQPRVSKFGIATSVQTSCHRRTEADLLRDCQPTARLQVSRAGRREQSTSSPRKIFQPCRTLFPLEPRSNMAILHRIGGLCFLSPDLAPANAARHR